MAKTLNVGIIGYGFMGRTHSNAYRKVANFFDVPYKPVLKTICGLEEKEAKAFADRWGFETYATDWHEVIDDKSIDVVDIYVPNLPRRDRHRGRRSGGPSAARSPWRTRTGLKMVDAVEKACPMASFNYRRAGGDAGKRLIDEGRLGKIFHYRNFLQDWTISAKVPQGGMATWRLDVKAAGSGVTGDLLAHCIDTAMWHNGPISSVCAMTETFVKERMHAETGKVEPVGIDDACTFFCRFDNGSMGNFESTRYARGHKALYTFEINGEHASIAWDLHDLHRLSYFDHRDDSIVRGWRSIHVTDGDMPYMGKWWVPGLQIGYEHSFVHQTADFLTNMAKGKPTAPTFRDALATQKVCEAVLASAKVGRWKTSRTERNQADGPMAR